MDLIWKKDNHIALNLSNYLTDIGSIPFRFEVDNIPTSGIEYGGSLSLLYSCLIF
jgi:hypothetical protein